GGGAKSGGKGPGQGAPPGPQGQRGMDVPAPTADSCQRFEKTLRSLASGLYGREAGLKESEACSTMPMQPDEIQRLIKERIPDAEVTIRDLAGDGDHYAATVVAASFRGQSRVQQHQMVYDALRGQMGGVLHALALQTAVPDA